MFIFILPCNKNLGIKVKKNDQVQFTIKTGFENSGHKLHGGEILKGKDLEGLC